MEKQAQLPWYHDGLHFSCTQCGHCCQGPGYVWVSDDEIDVLARHFEMDHDSFTKVYTRKVGRHRSLREQANDNCIFYDRSVGCLVYDARPTQCRTWPFWEQNLETPRDWHDTESTCPGSGHGQLFTLDEITARLLEMKQR